jgi:hypothetical protein
MFKAGQFERLAVSLFVTIALKTEVRTEHGTFLSVLRRLGQPASE